MLTCLCCGKKFNRPTAAEIVNDGIWRSFFCSRQCRAKGVDTSRKYHVERMGSAHRSRKPSEGYHANSHG